MLELCERPPDWPAAKCDLGMGELTLAGRPILSVFALLGDSENDLTRALGFVLDRCPTLLREFIANLGMTPGGADWAIRLQAFGPDPGVHRHRAGGAGAGLCHP